MSPQRIKPLLLMVFCAVLLVSSGFTFEFSELENSVTEHTLNNGLTILIMERHDAPVASFVTYSNVGSADDPKGYTGLAHMFEHMAFKGTTTLGTTDINKEMALNPPTTPQLVLFNGGPLGLCGFQERFAETP